MFEAAVVIGGLGIVAACALGVAAKVFYVEIDPLIVEIEEALPGANCGGCGHPGCSGAAVAIAGEKMAPSDCVAGGPDVHMTVAAIMGVEVTLKEPEVAQVGCRYPVQRSDVKYEYMADQGVYDCRAAALLYGGPKDCPIGCIGLGSCVRSCPFDALYIGPDGLPLVNEEKCTGCGTCVRTCPMGIMRLTSVSNRILDEYTWEVCTAPCQRRCPAGIDVPRQIYYTALGDYDAALRVIKERNPLPLICGRICPNPCELACRRNLVDEPVAINPLKRFVADLERESGVRQQPFKAPETEREIAVIGGGVEGLSASFFMARLGHSPKIFEWLPELGGLLRTAIPRNRLPREVLDWEIQGILDMGVTAEVGSGFGRDFGLASLFEDGFEAVLLAVGGWDALLMSGRMADVAPALPGLNLLLPLTLAWTAGQEINLGQKVVLVGDRSTLSAAKRCAKLINGQVTLLCSRTRIEMGLDPADIKAAEEAGVKIMPAAWVTRLKGKGDNLTGVMISQGYSETLLQADTVIVAGGRLPDMIVTPRLPEPNDDDGDGQAPEIVGREIEWTTIMPYGPTSGRMGDMFAPKLPVSDYRAAVEAIGSGRRAAATIHKFLGGEAVDQAAGSIGLEPPKFGLERLDHLIDVGPRESMPILGDEERLDPTLEIELGLNKDQVKTEAKRCLNCGLICYYRTQYH